MLLIPSWTSAQLNLLLEYGVEVQQVASYPWSLLHPHTPHCTPSLLHTQHCCWETDRQTEKQTQGQIQRQSLKFSFSFPPWLHWFPHFPLLTSFLGIRLWGKGPFLSSLSTDCPAATCPSNTPISTAGVCRQHPGTSDKLKLIPSLFVFQGSCSLEPSSLLAPPWP